jgi:hypothetical protein
MHTNTHYAAARNHSDGTESDQRFSQAEATLALAYEQRTANLIAWHDSLLMRARKDTPEALDLMDKIKERLGL